MDYSVMNKKFYQLITITAQGKADRAKYERIYKALLQCSINAFTCRAASEYFGKWAKNARAESLKYLQKIPPLCESLLVNLPNGDENKWKFKVIARIAYELIDELRNQT